MTVANQKIIESAAGMDPNKKVLQEVRYKIQRCDEKGSY